VIIASVLIAIALAACTASGNFNLNEARKRAALSAIRKTPILPKTSKVFVTDAVIRNKVDTAKFEHPSVGSQENDYAEDNRDDLAVVQSTFHVSSLIYFSEILLCLA
jgi:hypothetical protein